MEHIGGKQNVNFQLATESRRRGRRIVATPLTADKEGIPCDNGPNGCRMYRAAAATAATAADQTEPNQNQTAKVRPRNMKRSISAVTLTEASKCNVTDNEPCNTDLEARSQNSASVLAAASFHCIEYLGGEHNVNFQTGTEVKDSGATHRVRCDNSPTDSHIRVVTATAADQTKHNQERTAQIRLLPRKLTRLRSTMTRSISAATLTEIDKADVTDNGPCNPDLEACCQNISALLAAAVKNNTNDKDPGPTPGFIYGYMRVLFALLQLEPECCVYSYIYIKRLQNGTGLKIGAGNWKKLLIVTLLLASKFVDDITLTNKHFAFALKGWSLKRINRLESVMMNALHWNVYVPISEYTTKYFELIQQPTKPTTTCNWQVNADAIKHYFNVNQNKYYQFMLHGLNLQQISPYNTK